MELMPPFSVTFRGDSGDVDLSQLIHSIFIDAPREELMETPQQQLTNWWMHQADREIEATVPKAVEYGSTDLVDIGRNIARLSGREVTDAQAAELGVFFYLEGKFARWRSAIIEGRPVSDDTLFDIGVYVRMAQRIRYSGGWPGVDLETPDTPTPNSTFHSMCDTPCGPGCQ